MRLILLTFFSFLLSTYGCEPSDFDQKMNGVCMVAPPSKISASDYDPIKRINANWVAIIPYSFCTPNDPKIRFDHNNQWWGEKTEGVKTAIIYAKKSGLNIMLKPHIWVKGQGWAGDLKFSSETDIDVWTTSYSKYILHFSAIAQEMDVEMISIGTEIRNMVKDYPNYWIELISKIRKIYTGKITYSSNWDNYQNVKFWDKLDYIGIDAYFPTITEHTPTVHELLIWNREISLELAAFAKKNKKKIVFTEFGFKSIDYCTAGDWTDKQKSGKVNLTGQQNAYDAFFQSYWNESWFAGGFAWKWFYPHQSAGGSSDTKFTPQNKPAETIIKDWYKQYKNN